MNHPFLARQEILEQCEKAHSESGAGFCRYGWMEDELSSTKGATFIPCTVSYAQFAARSKTDGTTTMTRQWRNKPHVFCLRDTCCKVKGSCC
jgi:hypothetical protein